MRAAEDDSGIKSFHSQLFLSLFYMLLFAVMVGLCGCGGSGSGQKAAETIEVKPANNRLYIGESKQYTLESSYTGVIDSSVVWESTNLQVAKISPSGMVNCIAAGETDIKATLGGITYPAKLYVISTAVTDPSGGNLDVTGRWEGTYRILEAVNTTEIGKTYSYEFTLTQDGTVVDGVSSLRSGTPRFAVGAFEKTKTNVVGDILKFVFTYSDPISKTEIENNSGSAQIGTSLAGEPTLTGEAVENDSKGWNCRYNFVLTKQLP